ncbi:MAG: DUF4325 domain-containing protein [Clostridia bacterium]|nr:DUF4325 domain-containing protein [Bacillota bacterium]MBQ7035831.1 DUF4325 domain-containing protein [Clostridia bacterium]
MKFSQEKKDSIIAYILEKAGEGCETLSKTVSENLGINQNTVHRYIDELMEKGIIVRKKRGIYELKNLEKDFVLSRSAGELRSDIAVYERTLEPYVQNFSENVRSIWSYVFTEIINNAIDHSGAEKVVVNVQQNSLDTVVSIYDNGIGIFKKIRDHFGMESVEEAIGELFKGKLTTDDANHSGEGIFFSSKMVDDFCILSEGKFFAKNRFERMDVAIANNQYLQGTFVLMSLRNDTKKCVKEIFDQYANVDGGFWKTKLPLKNFFSSSPVSRSQAKRLCNRLEQFEEVELDFDGLDWMGQGFAHQLFIVFPMNFPQVKLIPIHMSEAVEKMYNHVMKT